MLKRHYLLFTLLVSILLLPSCNTESESTQSNLYDDIYTQIAASELQVGDPIPAPEGDPILTVTGLIGTSNMDDGSVSMDSETLKQVGEVRYKVDDPFDATSRTYQGVLMRDLIALWQIDDTATTVDVIALDDYTVSIPLSDIENYPVLFAMKVDGEALSTEKGPARLVYPRDQYSELQTIENEASWIWQIKAIEIR